MNSGFSKFFRISKFSLLLPIILSAQNLMLPNGYEFSTQNLALTNI